MRIFLYTIDILYKNYWQMFFITIPKLHYDTYMEICEKELSHVNSVATPFVLFTMINQDTEVMSTNPKYRSETDQKHALKA